MKQCKLYSKLAYLDGFNKEGCLHNFLTSKNCCNGKR